MPTLARSRGLAGGGGSVSGTSQTTDASGFAAVGNWTMGPARGPNTLTATSGTVTGSPLTLTVQGTWSLATHVQPQVLDNCLACHDNFIAPDVGDAATSYQTLLNGNGTMTRYVTPGDTPSDGSTFGILLFRLRNTAAPMPPGTPLSVANPTLYDLIRDWALDGALP